MFTEPTNSCRTISDLKDILREYKTELKNYSETSYNKVVALETNISVTTKIDNEGVLTIDSFTHPSKFTPFKANTVCLRINKKLAYSKCSVVSYENWLKMRIEQLSEDLKKCV